MLLKKKPPLLFTVGTAALLMGGGALAYWGLSRNLISGGASPTGVQFVPQAALMTLTVTTQENQWHKLRQFGTAETQQAFDTLLIEWRDRILTANGYRFKSDIKPWLGDEITVAFLPASANPDEADAGTTTEAVMILPIADPIKAQSLMTEPKDDSIRWVGRQYKGVNLQTINTTTGETLETAILGTDWLVIAQTASGIEQIVDSYKGAESVLETPGYRQALQRINTPQPFAQLFINLPATSQTLSGSSDSLPLAASQGLAASLSLENNGLHFLGTSWLAPDSERSYSDLKNGAGEMPRRLPDETVLMFSSGNLKQLWQSISGPEANASFLPIKPASLKAGLLSTTGLDLDKDLMPWMNGEFAFALLPPTAPSDPTGEDTVQLETGQLLLLVQVNDREAAEATWKKLDDAIQSRYRYQIETQEISSLPVTRWVSPFQGITMSHGWLDGNVTFFGVGSSIADAIAPRPQPSLAETSLFQQLTANAPPENNGHFFLDLQKISDLQGTLPIPGLTPDNADFTAAIQSLGVTAAIHDNRSIVYDISVKMSRGDRVKALP
jgi:hypothetical protein